MKSFFMPSKKNQKISSNFYKKYLSENFIHNIRTNNLMIKDFLLSNNKFQY